jgi:hypothetical protein
MRELRGTKSPSSRARDTNRSVLATSGRRSLRRTARCFFAELLETGFSPGAFCGDVSPVRSVLAHEVNQSTGVRKRPAFALTPWRFFRGAPGHQQMIQNFSAPRNKSSAGFFRCSFPKVRRNLFPVAPGDAIFAPEREQATPRRRANRRLICVQDNKTVPNSRRGRGSRWEWRLVERRTVAHQDKLRRLKETVNAACDSFFRRRGLPGKRHW